jgi:hypothetical protein
MRSILVTHLRLFIRLVLHGDWSGPWLKHGTPMGRPLGPRPFPHRSRDQQAYQSDDSETANDDTDELETISSLIER